MLLVSIVELGLFTPASAQPNRVALVIGVSDYRYVPTLPNATRDADTVAQSLLASGFKVTKLTRAQQLDRENLARALLEFRRDANGAEAAVVYFAGHGVEVDGKNWLLPINVQAETPDQLEVTGIPSNSFTNAVSGAEKVRLVILDACRDNPFTGKPGWSTGKRSVGSSRGLIREKNLPANVVVLLATQAGEAASDNGPFARALAASIVDDNLRISALPSVIAHKMRQLSGVDQQPDQIGIFEDPEWIFHPAANGPVAQINSGQLPATTTTPDTGSSANLIVQANQKLSKRALEMVDYMQKYNQGRLHVWPDLRPADLSNVQSWAGGMCNNTILAFFDQSMLKNGKGYGIVFCENGFATKNVSGNNFVNFTEFMSRIVGKDAEIYNNGDLVLGGIKFDALNFPNPDKYPSDKNGYSGDAVALNNFIVNLMQVRSNPGILSTFLRN